MHQTPEFGYVFQKPFQVWVIPKFDPYRNAHVTSCHTITAQHIGQNWRGCFPETPQHDGEKHHREVPKIGAPQSGWFVMENELKIDDFLGYPKNFRKPQYTIDVANIVNLNIH